MSWYLKLVHHSIKGNIYGANKIRTPQFTFYGKAIKIFVETEHKCIQKLDKNPFRFVVRLKTERKKEKKKLKANSKYDDQGLLKTTKQQQTNQCNKSIKLDELKIV